MKLLFFAGMAGAGLLVVYGSLTGNLPAMLAALFYGPHSGALT